MGSVGDFVRKMMLGREVEFKDGRLYFLGKECSVISNETFAKLHHNAIMEFGERGEKYLFDVGREQGKGAVKRYKKFGIFKNTLYKFGLPTAALFGYGEIELIERNEKEGTTKIKIKHSPIAEAWVKLFGKNDKPICHFLRGEFAGATSEVDSCEVETVETKCLAKGDPYCLVEIRCKK